MKVFQKKAVMKKLLKREDPAPEHLLVKIILNKLLSNPQKEQEKQVKV
jgi:hypothetical protein